MDFISKPLGYLFNFIFLQTNNYLATVLIIAFALYLLILPIDVLQKKNAQTLVRITPDINRIKAKYKDMGENSEENLKFQKEISQMYKKNHYSGASGCIAPFISLLMMIVFYNVMTKPLTFVMGLSTDTIASLKDTLVAQGLDLSSYTQLGIVNHLASCSQNTINSLLPGINLADIPNMMIGNISLAVKPSFTWPLIIIPVLACASTLISTLPRKFMSKNNKAPADIINSAFDTDLLLPNSSGSKDNTSKIPEEDIKKLKNKFKKFAKWGLQIYSSLITIVISFKLPVVVAFYWMFRSVLSVIKEVALFKIFPSGEIVEDLSNNDSDQNTEKNDFVKKVEINDGVLHPENS